MYLIHSWQSPQAIFLLLALFFMWQCRLAQKFWRILRAQEIHACLSHAPTPARHHTFTWVFLGANVAAFVCSLLLTLTRQLQNPFLDFLVILAGDIFFLFALHHLGYALLHRDGLIPPTAHQNLIAQATHRLSPFSRIRPFAMTAALLLTVLALMGPEGSKTAAQLQPEPLEIVLLLDLSQSMNARDIVPTRLEAALEEIDALTRIAPQQKYAFIYFTTETFVQLPMTMDPPAVRAFLEHITTDVMPTHGTDIPNALLAARKLFRLTDNPYPWHNVSRRILLLSDGEDHSDRLEDTLQVLSQDNIHVDVIGLGTPQGGQVFTADGAPLMYQNSTVISRFDDRSLRHIAEVTDGVYQTYQLPHDAAERLAYHWDTLQIALAPSGIVSIKTDTLLYHRFVIPLYLLALYLISEPFFHRVLRRRRQKKQPPSDTPAPLLS